MECNHENCFACIREGTKYDWSYECNPSLLADCIVLEFRKKYGDRIQTSRIKFSELEYLNNLRDEVLLDCAEGARLGAYLSDREAVVLGDSVSRLYMFLVTREPRLITIKQLKPLASLIERAAERSLPAGAVAYILDQKMRSFPKCWLNLVNGRSEENNEAVPETSGDVTAAIEDMLNHRAKVQREREIPIMHVWQFAITLGGENYSIDINEQLLVTTEMKYARRVVVKDLVNYIYSLIETQLGTLSDTTLQ